MTIRDDNGALHAGDGKFAVDPNRNGPAQVSLTSDPLTRTVPISMLAKLNVHGLPELPSWPATLPAPKHMFDNEGTDGALQSYVFVGDESAVFWTGDMYEDQVYNSMDDVGEDLGIDDEEKAAVVAYGEALHRRGVELATNLLGQALQDDAFGVQFAAVAAGESLFPEDLPGNAVTRAEARAVTALSILSNTERTSDGEGDDEDVSAVADMISDLMHYAKARGIDFDDALRSGEFIFEDEQRDPEN